MIIVDIDNRKAYQGKSTDVKLIEREKLEEAFLCFKGPKAIAKLLTLEEITDTLNSGGLDTRVFDDEFHAAKWLWDDKDKLPKFIKKHMYIEFKPPTSKDLAPPVKNFRIATLKNGDVEVVAGKGTARSPRHKLLLEEAVEWGSLTWPDIVTLYDGDEALAGKAVRGAIRRNILEVKS